MGLQEIKEAVQFIMAARTFHGIGVSEGIRIAKVFIYRQPKADFNRNVPPEKIPDETKRFKAAVRGADQEISGLISHAAEQVGEKQTGILKGQKSILADPAFTPEIEKLITGQHFSAEKAVRQLTDQFVTLFSNMANPYMRERAADVRDAGNRLIRFLTDPSGKSLSDIHEKVILVADDLSASDTVQLNRNYVLGFATEKGGKTAHTSIFAKSLGIPAVVGAAGLLTNIRNGDTVILDGAKGLCIQSPDQTTIKSYQQKYESEQKQRRLYESFSHRKMALRDGGRVIAAANIGSSADIEYSLGQGAEAAGLMRTETLFLSRTNAPTEEEQFSEYRKAAEAFAIAGPGEVIIRTLDIGGDKAAGYFNIPQEANPFLGLRAIRLCLKRVDIFLTQLRAILRASAFGKIKIMFPMISGIEELRQAKTLLQQAKDELSKKGIAYDQNIQTGIMIEIPSAALMSDALAAEADFFSIGTNDLTQYTLAADRSNQSVSDVYDPFDPGVLRLIRMTAEAAKRHNIPVGMCGNMAGDPVAVPLLVGMGMDELSMAAGEIPKTKYTLSRCSRKECEKLAEKSLHCVCAREVHKAAEDFHETLFHVSNDTGAN